MASQLSPEERQLAQPMSSTIKQGSRLACGRCAEVMTAHLPAGDLYCRACIQLGRVCEAEDLYYFPQAPFPQQSYLNWSGNLTPYQQEVADQLLLAQQERANILIKAVTGAGKTEMIYRVVDQVLQAGGAVALVSPRIDVCKELYGRISRDFSCPVSLLYGGSDPYQRSSLVISTVHQLYRFYQAFELIIIDEVDAFPFVDNASLYHAVEQALAPTGSKVFLTATSTDQLDRQVSQGKLKEATLARRFHANPLVVPKPVWLSGLLEQMVKGRLPKTLLADLSKQAETGYPLLIFFPHIEMGQEFQAVLQAYFPAEAIGFVSSQTEDRAQLVEEFRAGKLRILVTTTILERGVTFPGVDVFVLWSNHRLYTKSSLVQIAGRVGRSKDRPTGLLNFYHDGLTRDIKRAIAEIKTMNQKGGFA